MSAYGFLRWLREGAQPRSPPRAQPAGARPRATLHRAMLAVTDDLGRQTVDASTPRPCSVRAT